ncbi:hypothetical protein H310_05422 [Aphanomyces invadans]|uniref:GH18 domain-containing protein n=1 Tax=Aphanomyces invadans TaxID=157072 RepID=A0A024UAS8_9STRA|nr:hypothetical protein H310_05422 [Aphanomyces invadans]ETW02982.1 hypothetical protein H310_05422 [Aphanomyces invadans]|eukprot:XP_008868366.1 hypothetical protein H310_05422 [Aphanomyces invadans]
MGCHWWPLPLLIFFTTGLGFGISFLTKTGVFATSTSSSPFGKKTSAPTAIPGKDDALVPQPSVCMARNQYLKDNKTCTTCPGTKSGNSFSVFWESQADGCQEFAASEAAKYVTHIYWGFATIDATGAVSQKLQGNDATLTACIKTFQNMCIQNYVSIGGATERKTFLQLKTQEQWNTFGKTAASLVQKFNFTGVDIDDESGNADAGGDWYKNAQPQVVGYISALRKQLDALPRGPYRISWDEFPGSFEKGCDDPAVEYGRCFPTEILPLVNQVNNMLYNNLSPKLDGILQSVPTTWGPKVGKDKLVIGGCVGKGGSGVCADYGDVPTTTQLTAYATTGAKYQGAMLWTSSADWRLNKGATTVLMGKAGNYGVDW